jgi:hypothetical protein
VGTPQITQNKKGQDRFSSQHGTITQNKKWQDRFGSQHGTAVVSIQNAPITYVALAVTAKQTPFLSP